jgi:hypothetical protein
MSLGFFIVADAQRDDVPYSGRGVDAVVADTRDVA